MIQLKIIIKLAFILVVALSQQCGKIDKLDRLQAGSYTIQSDKFGQTRFNAYSIPIVNFQMQQIQYEVAISASQIINLKSQSGIDYKLSGGKQKNKNNLLIVVYISTKTFKWTSMKISYLLTLPTQFLMGSHQINSYQASNAQKSKDQISTEKYLPSWRFQKTISYESKIFISGLRTSDPQYEINIINSTVDEIIGKLSIQFTVKSKPGISYISFSYIIYQIDHLFFVFNTPTGLYQIIGVTQMKGSSIQKTKKFTICKQFKCGQNKRINNGICTCLNGYNEVDGKCLKIVQCLKNQIIVDGSCVCFEGFERSLIGQCQEILLECEDKQVRINNQCVCQQNYAKNINNQCERQCGENQIFDKNSDRCDCVLGFRKQGQVCVSICRVDQTFTNGNCMCQDGFVDIQNRCRLCPIGSILNPSGNSCLCVAAQIFDQKNWRCIICLQNSQPNNQKTQCECEQGYQFNDDKTACLITCQENQIVLGSQCVCSDNFYRLNDQCEECSNNSLYDGQICVCNNRYFGNGITCNQCHQSCETCSGAQANQCLSCVNPLVIIQGQCQQLLVQCPNRQFRTNENLCQNCSHKCIQCTTARLCQQCQTGYLPDNTGQCKPICGDGKKTSEEQCDDSNSDDGDGCSNQCSVEVGWKCDGGNINTVSICSQLIELQILSTDKLFDRVILILNLTRNLECTQQNKNLNLSTLLEVTIINSSTPVEIIVEYIPQNMEFIIDFNFFGSSIEGTVDYSIRYNMNAPQAVELCILQLDQNYELTGQVVKEMNDDPFADLFGDDLFADQFADPFGGDSFP